MSTTYTCKAKIWLYPGAQGAWHFLTVPKTLSAKIKKAHGTRARGWGSLRITAKIGKTSWDTSIFPERKSDTYLLPLKASVRTKEGLYAKDSVKVTIVVH